jgi:hypothetical protein
MAICASGGDCPSESVSKLAAVDVSPLQFHAKHGKNLSRLTSAATVMECFETALLGSPWDLPCQWGEYLLGKHPISFVRVFRETSSMQNREKFTAASKAESQRTLSSTRRHCI